MAHVGKTILLYGFRPKIKDGIRTRQFWPHWLSQHLHSSPNAHQGTSQDMSKTPPKHLPRHLPKTPPNAPPKTLQGIPQRPPPRRPPKDPAKHGPRPLQCTAQGTPKEPPPTTQAPPRDPPITSIIISPTRSHFSSQWIPKKIHMQIKLRSYCTRNTLSSDCLLKPQMKAMTPQISIPMMMKTTLKHIHDEPFSVVVKPSYELARDNRLPTRKVITFDNAPTRKLAISRVVQQPTLTRTTRTVALTCRLIKVPPHKMLLPGVSTALLT